VPHPCAPASALCIHADPAYAADKSSKCSMLTRRVQANASAGDMAKRLKSAEGSSSEMQRRIDELTVQLTSAGGDNQRLQAELARLRTTVQELQDKNDALARENKQLSGPSARPFLSLAQHNDCYLFLFLFQ